MLWFGELHSDGRLKSVHFSDEMVELLGYTHEEFPDTPETLPAHVHPDDRQAFTDAETGSGEGQIGDFETECRVLTKSEGYLWFRATGRLVRSGDVAIALFGSLTGLTAEEGTVLSRRCDELSVNFHDIDDEVLDRLISDIVKEDFLGVFLINIDADTARVIKNTLQSLVLGVQDTVPGFCGKLLEAAQNVNGAYRSQWEDICRPAELREFLSNDDRKELLYSTQAEDGEVWKKGCFYVLSRQDGAAQTVLLVFANVGNQQAQIFQLQHRLALQNAELLARDKANRLQQKVTEDMLGVVESTQDYHSASDRLLCVVAEYYDADRAYLFELNDDRTLVNNTAEWCRAGVTAEIDNLQNVPVESVSVWLEEFQRSGAFYLNSLNEEVEEHSITYKILEAQGITSLITAPLYQDDAVCGFIGVDNPRRCHNDLLILKTVAFLVQGEILTKLSAQNQALEAQQRELEKALELAQKASSSKTRFLFSMSHDIRTPMNAITGYAAIARKHLHDLSRVEECLEKIDISAQQLLGLINQVLEMSRIESGKVALQETPVDLVERTEAMLTIVWADATMKNITLSSDVSALINPWVLTDRERVSQIIVNIMGNAVKYTPEGGYITLSVGEEPCPREGFGTYVFTVTDTGIGMSQEYIAHIFDEFSRENTSTVSGIQGTGLGMSIVKQLLDLMDGIIKIESAVGRGTKVSVSIPMRWDVVHRKARQQAWSQSAIKLEGKRVLLVEDNEMNREIAEIILEEQGMLVETAEDGDVAVEMVEHSAPGYYDLVLMDIQMPRMNGYWATRAIRSLPDEKLASVPIIAMTANAFEEDRKNALDAGMNAHLSKPIVISKLVDTLTEFMG